MQSCYGKPSADNGSYCHESMPPIFSLGAISLYCCDFLEFNELPSESVDLIVTSPPYSVGIAYDRYDDTIPYDKYLEFMEKALRKCYNLAKPDGRICLNIPLDSPGDEPRSTYVDIACIAKGVGWKYRTTIIWCKHHTSRRTAWGSWMSAAAPMVIAPVELILVMYKERWKKEKMGQSDLTREEFIEWTEGVWNIPPEHRSKVNHPAPFPLQLPYRCIKLFSFVGDVVLDPFVGSGTTLIACHKLGRIGIGVEISEAYCNIAIKRLLAHCGQQTLPSGLASKPDIA